MKGHDYLVDIPMCVYNHERFVGQAIEGIIAQQTKFRFRLIIGDDFSQDNSRSIIKRYQEKYPDIIFPVFHDQNLGAQENSKFLFKMCTSKYIALCDGDDYWTDPLKLQKQIRFLETHSEYVCHCHNALIEKDGLILRNYNDNLTDKTVSRKELITTLEIPTSSVVFHNVLLNKMPGYVMDYILDIIIYFALSFYGKFYLSTEIMSNYRVHDGGWWMGQGDLMKINRSIEIQNIMLKNLPLDSEEKSLLKRMIIGLKQNRMKFNANQYNLGFLYLKDLVSVVGAKLTGYEVSWRFLMYSMLPNSIVNKIQTIKGDE